MIYPNNCGSHRRLQHSALLRILHLSLPCSRISFTLNTKLFSLNNPFAPTVVSSLTQLTVFISQLFSFCRSFSPRSCTSVIVFWQAFYMHSKYPHSSSLRMLSGANIIFTIIIITSCIIIMRRRDATFTLLIHVIKHYRSASGI